MFFKSLLSVCCLVGFLSGFTSFADAGRRPGPGDGHGHPPPPPPPPRKRWVPVYRFFSGTNHFQTLNYNDGAGARMNYEGISFDVMVDPADDTQPLYRCLVPRTMNHFISNAANCEGQSFEGQYGFVYSQARPDANSAIYRCSTATDHLSTLNPQECVNAGYRVEGVQGFTHQ